MPIAITDDHQELAATVRGVLTSHKTLPGRPGPARGRRGAPSFVLG